MDPIRHPVSQLEVKVEGGEGEEKRFILTAGLEAGDHSGEGVFVLSSLKLLFGFDDGLLTRVDRMNSISMGWTWRECICGSWRRA